jgi:hypothetical protein
VTNNRFYELMELKDKLSLWLGGKEMNELDDEDDAEAEQMRRFFGVA